MLGGEGDLMPAFGAAGSRARAGGVLEGCVRSMRHERAVRPAMPMGAAWAVAGMGYGRYMGGCWWEVRRRVEEVRLGREGWAINI